MTSASSTVSAGSSSQSVQHRNTKTNHPAASKASSQQGKMEIPEAVVQSGLLQQVQHLMTEMNDKTLEVFLKSCQPSDKIEPKMNAMVDQARSLKAQCDSDKQELKSILKQLLDLIDPKARNKRHAGPLNFDSLAKELPPLLSKMAKVVGEEALKISVPSAPTETQLIAEKMKTLDTEIQSFATDLQILQEQNKAPDQNQLKYGAALCNRFIEQKSELEKCLTMLASSIVDHAKKSKVTPEALDTVSVATQQKSEELQKKLMEVTKRHQEKQDQFIELTQRWKNCILNLTEVHNLLISNSQNESSYANIQSAMSVVYSSVPEVIDISKGTAQHTRLIFEFLTSQMNTIMNFGNLERTHRKTYNDLYMQGDYPKDGQPYTDVKKFYDAFTTWYAIRKNLYEAIEGRTRIILPLLEAEILFFKQLVAEKKENRTISLADIGKWAKTLSITKEQAEEKLKESLAEYTQANLELNSLENLEEVLKARFEEAKLELQLAYHASKNRGVYSTKSGWVSGTFGVPRGMDLDNTLILPFDKVSPPPSPETTTEA